MREFFFLIENTSTYVYADGNDPDEEKDSVRKRDDD